MLLLLLLLLLTDTEVKVLLLLRQGQLLLQGVLVTCGEKQIL